MAQVFSNDLLTEKGNLRSAAVASFKAQALEKIDLPVEATPNGEYAMVLGTTEDGRSVYLTVRLTVGYADPFIKTERKPKAKAEPIEIPDLF